MRSTAGRSGAFSRVSPRLESDFVLWDGFELPSPSGDAVATIAFRNRRALFSWVWDPELNFGEAYMFGAVEIRGDLVALLEEIYRARPRTTPRSWWLWQRSNDVHAARENVHRHYDLGNEFYRLWLDPRNGLHLRLFPHTPQFARRCADREDGSRSAASSRSSPVIVSSKPAAAGDRSRSSWRGDTASRCRPSTCRRSRLPTARQRAEAEGSTDRVEFVEDDYRNVTGTFDVFVSVGMLEHVGLARLSHARSGDRPRR